MPHTHHLRAAQTRLVIHVMDQPLTQIDGSAGARRHFRYFDYVMAAFVAILLLSRT